MNSRQQVDYFGKSSPQFPIAPLRVVYTKAGKRPAASVVPDQSVVIDHKLYWAPVGSLDEGRYLCALFNTKAVKARVQRYQSQGQWGARDIDKYLFNAPIPKFDTRNTLQGELARAEAVAESVAVGVTPCKREDYRSLRRRIYSALDGHGIGHELEALTDRLLG